MANPKAADVVNQAKLFANDKDGTKHDEATYLAYLNTAVQVLFQRHPSAFYLTTIVTDAPGTIGLGDEIAISPEYAEAIAHYIASKCLVEGAGANDEFNARLAKMNMDVFDKS